jgi:leucyl/phenylalanyl-tRNA--protein transferase
MTITILPPRPVWFPPPESALQDPDGLLAIGGALTGEWLLAAYAAGIFPWFNDDREPILWWSPDPRAVLAPDQFTISRSLAKRIRNGGFSATFDTAFDAVTSACAAPRAHRDGRQTGTWITPRMRIAYGRLHTEGYAHSVEIWHAGTLAGGLYGVSLGDLFFGESMFTRIRDASKIALYVLARQLARWDFRLIDCQVLNPHLQRLGVRALPRQQFLRYVRSNDRHPTRRGHWQLDPDLATMRVDQPH